MRCRFREESIVERLLASVASCQPGQCAGGVRLTLGDDISQLLDAPRAVGSLPAGVFAAPLQYQTNINRPPGLDLSMISMLETMFQGQSCRWPYCNISTGSLGPASRAPFHGPSWVTLPHTPLASSEVYRYRLLQWRCTCRPAVLPSPFHNISRYLANLNPPIRTLSLTHRILDRSRVSGLLDRGFAGHMAAMYHQDHAEGSRKRALDSLTAKYGSPYSRHVEPLTPEEPDVLYIRLYTSRSWRQPRTQ